MARKREGEEKYKMDSVKFVIFTQEEKKGSEGNSVKGRNVLREGGKTNRKRTEGELRYEVLVKGKNKYTG